MSPEDRKDLQDLHDWMRENGVKCAQVGITRLELLPVSKPAEERKPLTPEDIAKAIRERKRRAYEVELGHAVTDEMLERLP